MDYCLDFKIGSPTLLIISHDREKFVANSAIMAAFNRVHISALEVLKIVCWVQQHQPDLIIIDLSRSQIVQLQLIPALRLDWLTRNIPILIIADSPSLQPLEDIDYDACLTKPYSPNELEQAVCSLISVSASKSDGQAA